MPNGEGQGGAKLNTMKDIVIIGTGGLSKEIKCLIDAINMKQQEWNLVGFIDNWGKSKGEEIFNGKKVIGNFDDLNAMQKETYAIVAIGTPGRIKTAAVEVKNPLIKFANLIHPSVEMLSSVTMGVGNIISFGAFVSCNVELGNFNFFNTKSAVGHDTKIGSFNVFNPNVQISGNVKIGNENFWGLNSCVLQNKTIGNNNAIGACSFIMRNIKDNSFYFGIPATKQNV
jgi:sugar O-acyltransferase (sialic acid O-acetyltransferase NeuD family)